MTHQSLLFAVHCRTPMLIAIDNRGSAIRSIVYHRSQAAEPLDERISRTTYTALGAVDSQTDARFFTEHANAANAPNNFCYGRSLSGKVVHTASVDAGETETLFDIEGRRCWSADSRDTVMRHDYDPLGRPTTVTEQHNKHITVTERLIYADTASASSHQNLAVSDGHNILGQLIYHLDPAGVVKTDSFSLSGTPLAQTRQLLADDDVQVNWPAFNRFTELSGLSRTAYCTQWQLDALGATIAQWDANGNRQRLLYNVSGQLRSSHLQQAEKLSEQMIVGNFDYTAAGQVLEETAGNGVRTVYTFEPETQRLLSVYSSRPFKNGRPTVLQDLHYVYDPVGNILSIDDGAQQTKYFANQKTSAQRHYSYDTLYQLIKAGGREDANAAKQTQALPPLKTPLPEAADGQLSAYTREYQYDRGGNLIQIRHTGAHSYTRTIEIAGDSNRAAFVSSGADGRSLDKETQHFDQRGNLLALSTGQRLRWNLRNQLIQATVIDRADGDPNDEEHYRYGSDGMRVSKTTQKKTGLQKDKVIYLPGLELRTQNNGKEVLDVILIGQSGRCQVRVLHWENRQPEQLENDQLRYSVDDQIGSSLIELDSQGDKLSEEVYYPYGGTALWSAKSKIEAKYKYLRYSGKERDETGLYYYGYRYYMPWLGRWLNPDPAGTVDGLNLFRMVRNNPIRLKDNDGLVPIKDNDSRVLLPNEDNLPELNDLNEFIQFDEKLLKNYRPKLRHTETGKSAIVEWTMDTIRFVPSNPQERIDLELLRDGKESYAGNFLNDFLRGKYCVIIEGTSTKATPLEVSNSVSEESAKLESKLEIFRKLVPDNYDRATISELAHQGYLAHSAQVVLNHGKMDTSVFTQSESPVYNIIVHQDTTVSIVAKQKYQLKQIEPEKLLPITLSSSIKTTLTRDETGRLAHSGGPTHEKYVIEYQAPVPAPPTIAPPTIAPPTIMGRFAAQFKRSK